MTLRKLKSGQAAHYAKTGTAAELFAQVTDTPHAIGVADTKTDGFVTQLYAGAGGVALAFVHLFEFAAV